MKINKKGILLLVIGAAILQLAITFMFTRDPYRASAEEFIRANSEIQSHVGNISSISMSRLMSVNAAEGQPAYRLYDFIVNGDRHRANITVRATRDGDALPYEFSVDSIDPLN